jgi:hypothetical protein
MSRAGRICVGEAHLSGFIARGRVCAENLIRVEAVMESDHVIVLGEAHLRRILKYYADYYNNFRAH